MSDRNASELDTDDGIPTGVRVEEKGLPLFIYRSMLHRFKAIKSRIRGDSILLFLFYYETARIQSTKQIYCNNAFTVKGTDLSIRRVMECKKALMEIGVISMIYSRRSDGTIKTRYILVRVSDQNYGDNRADPTGEVQGTISRPKEKASDAFHHKRTNPQCGFRQANAHTEKEENTHTKECRSADAAPTTHVGSSSSGGQKKQRPPTCCHAMAVHLADTLEEIGKRDIPTARITAWTKDFHKLFKELRQDEDRIWRVLKWYRDYRKKPPPRFVIIAECGRSFCEKFEKMEAAIVRAKNDAAFAAKKRRQEAQRDWEDPVEVPNEFRIGGRSQRSR